jgi:hypothetical protein
MKTSTLEHAVPTAADDVLLERLRVLTMPVDADAGTIRIGVADDAGHLYRVIETSSVVEAVRVFETLNDLGFVPHSDRGSRMRVFQTEAPTPAAHSTRALSE